MPAYRRENNEKALFIVYPHFEKNFALEMPLKAILAPKVTNEAITRLVSASPIEILRALAPSTLMQISIGVDPEYTLRLLADAARQLPCYHILLGADFGHVPTILAELLDS